MPLRMGVFGIFFLGVFLVTLMGELFGQSFFSFLFLANRFFGWFFYLYLIHYTLLTYVHIPTTPILEKRPIMLFADGAATWRKTPKGGSCPLHMV
ncbi:hypothetical protein Hanom_Chr04g00355071 [Helianthus anomalus]